MRSEPSPRPMRQHHREADNDIEELVSIGIESVRRADDAVQQLRRALSQTRRRMWTGVVVAVFCIVTMITSIALGLSGSPDGAGLARVMDEFTGPRDRQGRGSEQLARTRSEVTALPERKQVPQSALSSVGVGTTAAVPNGATVPAPAARVSSAPSAVSMRSAAVNSHLESTVPRLNHSATRSGEPASFSGTIPDAPAAPPSQSSADDVGRPASTISYAAPVHSKNPSAGSRPQVGSPERQFAGDR